jgi:phage-related protein
MDALDLVSKIKMDISEYEKGLDDAKSKAEKSGGGISSAFGKIAKVGGKALVGLTKATAAAVGAATVAVGGLVMKSVEAYSEFEQLEGGVSKLYGTGGKSIEEYAESVGKSVDKVQEEYANLEKAQDLVMQNAREAYKTAGMSMNEYMDTATSLSASLINSLGGNTVEAAKQTDVAMRAISDNFNTFGGDIGMIQGAFQGFAKQNYTMLDNLKLGYGGTKEEMERLIADANKWAEENGKAADLTIDSFSDVVTAIELIQEKQNIAGTTEREAATTIQGALGMTKAAWQNLLTDFGNGEADLKKSIDSVVDSASQLVKNVMPIVNQALSGITQLITQVAPMIGEKIPELLAEIVPQLTQAAIGLVDALISGIESNLDKLVDGVIDIAEQLIEAFGTIIPKFASVAQNIILSLVNGISKLIPTLMTTIVKMVGDMVKTFVSNIPLFVQAGLGIIKAVIQGLTQALPELIAMLPEIITSLVEGLTESIDMILEAVIEIFNSLVELIPTLIDMIVEVLPDIINTIVDFLVNNVESIVQAALTLLQGIITAIPKIITALVGALPKIINTIVQALVKALPQIIQAAITLLMGIIQAIPQIINALVGALPEIINTIVTVLIDNLPLILDAGIQLFMAVVEAIPQIIPELIAMLPTIITNIVSTLLSHAGDVLSAGVELFMEIANAIPQVVGDVVSGVGDLFTSIINKIKSFLGDMADAGKYVIEGLWTGIKDKFNGVVNKVKEMVGKLPSAVKKVLGIESPSKVFAEIGGYMAEGLGVGWDKEIKDVSRDIEDGLNYKGNIDLSATTSVSTANRTISAKDLELLMAGMTFQFNHVTEMDGKAIHEDNYSYTLGRMSGDTRQMRIAHGGAY